MIDLFLLGGPVMYIILLVSIYGGYVFFERMMTLYLAGFDYSTIINKVRGFIAHNQFRQCLDYLSSGRDKVVFRILLEGLTTWEQLGKGYRERMEKNASMFLAAQERRVNHLAIVANIAPLLGLLGTVIGMIGAFNVITYQGVTEPHLLAQNISQALITTAFGLVVAIIFIVIHNSMLSKVDRIAYRYEKIIDDFSFILSSNPFTQEVPEDDDTAF